MGQQAIKNIWTEIMLWLLLKIKKNEFNNNPLLPFEPTAATWISVKVPYNTFLLFYLSSHGYSQIYEHIDTKLN